MFLKFLVARISGKFFLNESLEYSRLGSAVIPKLSEPSLRLLFIYAYKRRKGYSVEKQVLDVCLMEAVGMRV